MSAKTTASQDAPQPEVKMSGDARPAPATSVRRGMRYIGDGIQHYSGVPADPEVPLTWEQSRVYFGDSYEARRKVVEQEGAIYEWYPPKAAGDEDE